MPNFGGIMPYEPAHASNPLIAASISSVFSGGHVSSSRKSKLEIWPRENVAVLRMTWTATASCEGKQSS